MSPSKNQPKDRPLEQPKDQGETAQTLPTCECCASSEENRGYGYKADKAALLNRLSRVEGQIRGVRNMVEKDIYCDDILNQIAAVQAALKSVSRIIFQGHIKGCMVDKISRGELEAVDELLKTMEKMMK